MKYYRNVTNLIGYYMDDKEAANKLAKAPYNVHILPFNNEEEVANFNKARRRYIEDYPSEGTYQEIDLNGNLFVEVENKKTTVKENLPDKKITDSNLKDL